VIVLLHANGVVTLEQPDDFARFHCEIDGAHASLDRARQALSGIAELESQETAWVDMQALMRLGRHSTEQAADAWTASAQAMVAKAHKYGWVRDEPPAVKSHIVWRT
jgi:hypothetical protein